MALKSTTILLSVLLPFFSGCAHVAELQPEGRDVKIVRAEPGDCEDLGEVLGKSNADSQEDAIRGARNDFRNKAGRLGATHAVLETNNSKPVTGTWTQGIEILLGGYAVRCP